jgi:autoinducer 2-degrading protein
MQALLVESRITPQSVDAFAAAIADNAFAPREPERGRRQFNARCDLADATLLLLCELHEDEAAMRAHLASPTFARMNEARAAWVAYKPVWRYPRLTP